MADPIPTPAPVPVVPQPTLDSIWVRLEARLEALKVPISKVERMAIGAAWRLMQIAIGEVVALLQAEFGDLSKPEKKAAAMTMLSKFFDVVVGVIQIPVIPQMLENWIARYMKALLMSFASGAIDAMVTTFWSQGVFVKEEPKV